MCNNDVQNFLKGFNFDRIIFIDDDIDFAEGSSKLTSVINAIFEKDNETIKNAFEGTGISLIDALEKRIDETAIREELNNKWDDLRADEIARIATALRIEDTVEKTSSYISKLDELSTENLTIDAYSVEKWRDDRDTVLSNVTGNTVILVDLDLKNDKYGSKGGLQIVEEISALPQKTLFPGIFTGEATSHEDELTKSLEFSRERKFPVPVISKSRVEDIEKFIEGLKRYIYLNGLQELERVVTESFSGTVDESLQNYHSDVDYYSILASLINAKSEGEFVGDGLTRIIANEHRLAAAKKLRELTANNNKLDLLSHIDKNFLNNLSVGGSINPLKLKDAYDSTQFLSDNGIVTGIGDIYELTSDKGERRYYILLSQPCGLQVRPNGKRRGGSNSLSLVEIKEANLCKKCEKSNDRINCDNCELPKGCDKHRSNKYAVPDPNQINSGRVYFLNTFYDSLRKGAYVDFESRIEIPSQIIDACVFNCEGNSILSTGIEWKDNILEQGWKSLLDILKAWISDQLYYTDELVNKLSSIADNTIKAELSQAIYERQFGSLFVNGNISITQESNTFRIGIKRICRLNEQHSLGLLLKYARYQSAPGFPGELFYEESGE